MQWQCNTCDYWEDRGAYGECHLNPPSQEATGSVYLVTFATDWCSHYHNATAFSPVVDREAASRVVAPQAIRSRYYRQRLRVEYGTPALPPDLLF